MTQRRRDLQSAPIAPGIRHRESAGCEDYRVRVERFPIMAFDDPPFDFAQGRANIGDERIGDERHPFAPRARQQPVAHVARALRFRKQLARFSFLDERHAHFVLEKRDLLVERPRSDDAADEMGRRVGDKARLVETRRKDVAASAAADQNLAAAVFRALDEQRLGARRRCEDGRHRAGRAGADYDNAWHASSDWRNVRLNRPDSSSSGGAVPGAIRDTP